MWGRVKQGPRVPRPNVKLNKSPSWNAEHGQVFLGRERLNRAARRCDRHVPDTATGDHRSGGHGLIIEKKQELIYLVRYLIRGLLAFLASALLLTIRYSMLI